jgi:hypothetical protein
VRYPVETLKWCKGRRSRWVRYGLMVLVVWGGWALRLYGLNWDQGHGLHPDERYITWVASSVRLPERWADAFDPAQTTLNPYMWPPDGRPAAARARLFSYGHMPLYLLVLTAGGDVNEARLALVGRVLSALFDTLTLVLTWALGRLLYGATVGVLAAAGAALTVLHIQLAHFATFDTIVTALICATLLSLARFVRDGRRRDALAAGLCMGLAVSAKFSAVLLGVPWLMAHALRWEQMGGERRGLRGLWALLAVSALVAGLVFALTNPFALLQPRALVDNLRTQGAMLQGGKDFFFTLQYHGTWPYLYPIEQQLRWGMGLPLGVMAWAGLIYAVARAWRRAPRPEEWLLLTWVVIYFGFVGGLPVKFMRYMLPVLPVALIYGLGLGVTVGKKGLWGGRFAGRRLRASLVVGVLASALLYSLAFLNVYRGEHPWLRLSRWMYEHIPSGATIAHEQWDHQLPLMLRAPGTFQSQALDMYAPDTPEKLRALLEGLARSDYMVVASNRLYGSLARWPERYPLSRRYYECLFSGQLGYHLAAVPGLERHPQLGPVALVADPWAAARLASPLPPERAQPAPWTLDLGRADESFTVYDHPRPLLFCNVARLSWDEMARSCGEWPALTSLESLE